MTGVKVYYTYIDGDGDLIAKASVLGLNGHYIVKVINDMEYIELNERRRFFI